MAFPPGGGASAPPPPPRRNLRDVRRSVGTASLPPEAGPSKDSATVSMTCPQCGAAIDKTFTAEPDTDDTGAPPAPSSPGGPMGPGV